MTLDHFNSGAPQHMSRAPSIKASILARRFGVAPKDFVAICNDDLMISVRTTQSYVQKSDLPRITEFFRTHSVMGQERRFTRKWPGIGLYEQALDDCSWAFKSLDLRQLQVLRTPRSNIRSSGRFACVAKALIFGEHWAVRLLTREQPNLSERYRLVEMLKKDLPINFLDVRYFEDEVRVDSSGHYFPVVLVRWSEGIPLGEYLLGLCVKESVDEIHALRESFANLQSNLRARDLAHGDLSADNILVLGTPMKPQLVLVDYDSLWSPQIKELKCAVSNLGPMQHPGRGNPIGPNADQMAFRIFDAVLAFLELAPRHGSGHFAFENRFLVTAEELANGRSEIAGLVHRFVPEEAKAARDLFFAPFEVAVIEISVREFCEENSLSLVSVLRAAKKLWPGESVDGGYKLNCYQSDQLLRSTSLLT